MDEDSSAAVDCGHGSDHLHRLDLRLFEIARRGVKVAHPLMLRAIAASKKKNDRIDASKIADCLRCDFLRYRSLLVRQVVQLKTRVASLLMETGVSYDRQHLHRLGFVPALLVSKDAIDQSIRPLLRVSHDSILRLRHIETTLA